MAYRRFFFGGPEDIFDHLDRDEYVQQCRDQAIPGWATLTHDGRWLSPGRMGWFGMSDEDPQSQADYLTEANAYLDSLSGDMWLVTVDCHI
ncbi:hypothetical protein [Haloechinothrix halophila]|uniref:hypothetical protein n=1 Tax=Haloechinothrix halophila TaxID=1069073 RepID=UPI0004038C34|nr:hypothetical protein [Haloechinothrix halophila]